MNRIIILGIAAAAGMCAIGAGAQRVGADDERSMLSGRIVDEQGKPVEGVRIQLYSGFATRFQGQATVTDADGRYTFDPLTTGGGMQGRLVPGVRITHPKMVSNDGQTWWDVEVPAGQSVTKDFTLVTGGYVEGTLSFGSGQWTLRDFDIRVHSSQGRVAYATTDNSGHFVSDALFPGEYKVEWNSAYPDNPTITTVVVEAGSTTSFRSNLRFAMTPEKLPAK